jgi:hypothetical protein
MASCDRSRTRDDPQGEQGHDTAPQHIFSRNHRFFPSCGGLKNVVMLTLTFFRPRKHNDWMAPDPIDYGSFVEDQPPQPAPDWVILNEIAAIVGKQIPPFSLKNSSRQWFLEERGSIVGLSLAHCKLEAVPAKIAQLPSLRWLKLDHNHLNRLPAEFIKLSSLKRLELAHNNLDQWPEVLQHLNALSELDLSHNRITRIPPGVRGLMSIKTLSLSNNQLDGFPDIGSHLESQLEVLDLNNNRIHTSANILALRGLSWLDLGRNKLRDLHLDGQLGSLDCLLTRGNRLEAVSGLPTTLRYLDFSNNQVHEFPRVAHCTRLEVLKLTGNQIRAFGDNNPPSSLRTLYLDNNQVTELPQNPWFYLPLESLNYLGNPIADENRALELVQGVPFVDARVRLRKKPLAQESPSSAHSMVFLISVFVFFLILFGMMGFD